MFDMEQGEINDTVSMPESRTEQLVIQQMAEETLVYDLDRHKAHCLNRTSAIVWSHCDGTSTVSDVAELLHRDIGIPVSDDVVLLAISQLGKAKLLSNPAKLPFNGMIPARREVMKRVGLIGAAAMLLPVISSIVAPTAVSAATCLKSGAKCNIGVECCSSICKPGNTCL